MSDFLTNLVARSSSAAETIRPRLPSIFEPRRSAVPLRPNANLAPAVQDLELSEEHFSESARANAVTPLETSAARYKSNPEPATTQHPAVRPREANELSRLDQRPDPIPPRVAAILPSLNPHAASLAPPETRAAAIKPEETIEKRSPEYRANSSFSAQRESARENAFLRNIEAKNQPAAQAVAQPIPSDQIARLVKSLIPPITGQRSGARRHNEPVGSAPSESAIQVTIGRIEVRATSPQPAAKKDRASSSVMSLDEYLKQRRTSA